MSWLRIDDGFALHPKLVSLSDRQFRVWMRLLCWCARYRTRGVLSGGAFTEVGARPTDLVHFASLGLIDAGDDETLVIHDWSIYNAGTLSDRVATYLAEHPDASANDIHREIGGARKVVLAEVARQRSGTPGGSRTGTKSGSETGSGTGTKVVPKPVTRARTPAPKELNEASGLAIAKGSSGERPLAADFDLLNPHDLLPAEASA